MATRRRTSQDTGMTGQTDRHRACQFHTDKRWLDLQYNQDGTTIKPDELEEQMKDPPGDIDKNVLDRIHGAMIGMALGDALGAFVEFRPHEYMVANPVATLKGGGTWGLKKGQFTDDTSMGLCLANSLVARQGYVAYDQLVRYKWWHKKGYMSSTGSCFDIGAATRHSLETFEHRQKEFAEKNKIPFADMDYLSDRELLKEFVVNCSEEGVAGNGALMRLAPVPLFFYRDPEYAIQCSGDSGRITHGDQKAYDACRYYGALIVAAVNGESKEVLLDKHFYENNEKLFGSEPLHPDIMDIAHGSYKRKEGYAQGIRGKGYIVSALEAALWAFWSDKGSYETGALAAVNLGDDTDTTAAIYGQLAGAHYGYRNLPKKWVEQVYAKKFFECLSKWIVYEGGRWAAKQPNLPTVIVESPSRFDGVSPFEEATNSNIQSRPENDQRRGSKSSENDQRRGSKSSEIDQRRGSKSSENDQRRGSKSSENDQRRGSKSSENNQTASMMSPPMSHQSSDTKSDQRPRRYTVVDKAFSSQPNSHEQHASERAKSAERKSSTSSSQRVYFHNNVKSVNDVYNLIASLGDDYTTFAKAMMKDSVDGYWLLNHIDAKQLTKYGIKSKNHQQVILDKIEQMRSECPPQYVTEKK